MSFLFFMFDIEFWSKSLAGGSDPQALYKLHYTITATSVLISVFVYVLDSEVMFAIKKDIFMKRTF